jgi:alpha-D-ribose 1-methylphosphonate 5-triphosphate synthase subunit PhnG
MQMSDQAVRRLLALLAGEEIAIVRGPLTGLVMMSAQDACNVEFHLGEVLVTEAEVSYRGINGYGMVVGDDPERALARASVEAVGNSDNVSLYRRISRFFAAEAKKVAALRKREAALLAGTQVRFETMKRT